MENIEKGNDLNRLTDVIKRLIDFIEPFKCLLDTLNIDFINEHHWSNHTILPDNLRQELDEFIDECERSNQPANLIKHYSNFINSEESSSKRLSFYPRLKECIEMWNRHVVIDADRFLSYLFDESSELIEYNRQLGEKFAVLERQNRFMNEKKSYEVDTMSKFVANLCEKFNINTLVEIGSGRAYLSAQLSSKIFANKFNVVAIDSSENNVQSSIKRLDIMKRQTTIFSKSSSTSDSDRFKTFSQFIQSTSELSALLPAPSSNDQVVEASQHYALIGLHCCGNLSNSIVNLYVSNNEKKEEEKEQRRVKLLCNVACCYNLLNEKYANDLESDKDFKRTNVAISESSKFPMSDLLNRQKYSLNFNMRMLACHSLDRCMKSLDDFKELNDQALWHRCLFQVVLAEKFLDYVAGGLEALSAVQVGRKLVNNSETSFCVYVRKALEKLNLPNEKITDQEIDEIFRRHETSTKNRFSAFIQLKLILAPILEFIILLDRLIYLCERNYHDHEQNCRYNNYLIRLFDAAKSPRCYALVSYFRQSSS